MKRSFGSLLVALIFALCLAPAAASAAVTNQKFDQRSPLKWIVLEAKVGATASASGVVLGGVPGAGTIVDVQLVQAAVGVGGTSWTATVNKNGTAVCSTNPVMALASGTYKFLSSSTSPDIGQVGQETLPTGATRAVLKTDGTQLVARGDVLTVDIANTGPYTTAFTGQVRVVIDPNF